MKRDAPGGDAAKPLREARIAPAAWRSRRRAFDWVTFTVLTVMIAVLRLT